MKYHELDVVELLDDYPERGLKAGATGVIHQSFVGPPPAYFVEFDQEDDEGFSIMTSVTEDRVKRIWSYDTHSFVE